ncbi:hypothetical protein [Piscirickettsia salmonis]|uniref:hypothetical protein n=1 Tax=Piscirickettsia salmonis TaxID=1238 RepID=UPI0007C8E51F|nr:hypothetical protein A0O36_00385 [Piscirickettsiaceae bacterium NZ-RLO1]
MPKVEIHKTEDDLKKYIFSELLGYHNKTKGNTLWYDSKKEQQVRRDFSKTLIKELTTKWDEYSGNIKESQFSGIHLHQMKGSLEQSKIDLYGKVDHLKGFRSTVDKCINHINDCLMDAGWDKKDLDPPFKTRNYHSYNGKCYGGEYQIYVDPDKENNSQSHNSNNSSSPFLDNAQTSEACTGALFAISSGI